MNDVVREIQGNLIERKIREFDFLGKHGVAVAVLAVKRGGVVGTDSQFPALKFFRGHGFVARLYQRDFVEHRIEAMVAALPIWFMSGSA